MDDPEDIYPQAKKLKSSNEDPCCSLPFYLQDLCLLVVINDLGSYPTDLLASLPYWLRNRLLRCVPALDLCHLEGTSVANGVNIDEIWMSRQRKRLSFRSFSADDKTRSCFPLNICGDHRSFSLAHRFQGSNALITKVMADMSIDDEVTPGHKYLLEIASDLLTGSSGPVAVCTAETSIRQLISIPGDLLLSNLITGTTHQTCTNPYCSLEVWKQQGTPLKTQMAHRDTMPFYSYSSVAQVELTPGCLQSIGERCDVVEVLSCITEWSGLHSPIVNIQIGALSQSDMTSLCAENFASDLSLEDSAKCTSIVSRLLQKVAILSLQCDTYDHIGLLVGMIKVAIADEEKCRLKYLLCTIPDIYSDVSKPLTAPFMQHSFYQLILNLDQVDPQMFSKLLQAFLVAPCQHKQKVMVHTRQGVNFPKSIEVSQLASLDMAGMSIPSCGVEHKVLEFSSQQHFTNSLYLLLQFPKIRLKKLALVNLDKYSQYFHLCALHPDLQATKLVLDLNTDTADISMLLATVQEDLVSLFKLPSLQKIIVIGNWGQFMEVKHGLVLGLQARTQLRPLKKLSLELKSAHMYKIRDFRMLCDAIFSLPQLHNVTAVLGKGFADMIKQRRYQEVMIKSWRQKGSGVKLKSICLQTYELKLEKITQNLTFSWKPRLK